MTTYPQGTVVRYTPDPSRHEPRWCREGTAIADKHGSLADTYWSSGSGGAHHVSHAEMPSVEVLFHLDEYYELDRYSPASAATWATYHPDDRQTITSQHGLQHRWFIRKGAKPDLGTQIANAEEQVREAERQLRWAENDLTGRRHQLERLHKLERLRTEGGPT